MKKQFYRVKQLADQTFSRSGKGEEALSDELQTADRKVEFFRNALNLVSKRLATSAGSTQGQDPAAREKRLKKLPEYLLGLSMCDASTFDEDDISILKTILHECGKAEKLLANEVAEHELKVEQLVCSQLNVISEQDLPAIMKAKKQLNKLTSEKDSAASKYNHLDRQVEQNPTKLNTARDELEEVASRLDNARDALAADMFALVAKETHLAHTILQYIKLQRAYHESAMHSLHEMLPELERFINEQSVKPLFGYPLGEHLKANSRTIAFPIELCICLLHELALNEEGVLRIAGSSTKVRRMKFSLHAGLFTLPIQREYRDIHVIASVLKSYLRELPEPLLTFNLYDNFLAAARQPSEQARMNSLWETIHMLPEENFENLRYLIKFLSTVTKNHIRNKMTPSNLAIVVAPNLLWASDETTLDFNITGSINCVVETLIKHADWFYKDDINFFVTLTKEELLPEQYEYGFTSNFASGLNQTAALTQENSNGDYNSMSKSMYDSGQHSKHQAKSVLESPVRHTRSNSHDTSLILLDNNIKNAPSNSSLSDQSSPPHGSPKPVTRRKNKPLAPVPPNYTPEKNKNVDTVSDLSVKILTEQVGRMDFDKPAKPPRPVVADSGKVITGVQTINRCTYRQSRAQREESARSGSRENLSELRRQSLDLEKEPAEVRSEPRHDRESTLSARHVCAQSGAAARVTASIAKPSVPPPPRPVAAPRTLPPAAAAAAAAADEAKPEPEPRHKPAVPERPPALRPGSMRARASLDGDAGGATVLERAHMYSVDKQQPTVITVARDDRDARAALQTSRQLSQSEGSIEAPASPRPRLERPQVPAPPPPTSESTDL